MSTDDSLRKSPSDTTDISKAVGLPQNQQASCTFNWFPPEPGQEHYKLALRLRVAAATAGNPSPSPVLFPLKQTLPAPLVNAEGTTAAPVNRSQVSLRRNTISGPQELSFLKDRYKFKTTRALKRWPKGKTSLLRYSKINLKFCKSHMKAAERDYPSSAEHSSLSHISVLWQA